MAKKFNSKPVNIAISFGSRKDGEETPSVALYEMDIRGKAVEKIAALDDGCLRIDPKLAETNKVLAVGPDVENPATLESSQLLQYRAAQAIPEWLKIGRIDIPRLDWELWPPFFRCVSGKAYKCQSFWPPLIPPVLVQPTVALARNLQVERLTPILPFCKPLCYGRVEIYRRVCCCKPWDIEIFEPEIEIPWPPIFIDPTLEFNDFEIKQTRLLNATTEPAKRITWDERTVRDLKTIQALPNREAKVNFLKEHLHLLPIFCFGRIECSTKKIGETSLGPDGSFRHCFQDILTLKGCTVTYFYKVKQWIGGEWVYVYDGGKSRAYFSGNEKANLRTYNRRAETCYTPEEPVPGKGKPFVMLQSIGTTDSYRIKSPQQNTATGLNTILSPNAGLINPAHNLYDNAPLGGTLELSLYFDPGMRAVGAKYYRLSIVGADSANGNPASSFIKNLTDSVSWRKFKSSTFPPEIEAEVLGPKTIGAQNHLYEIPYVTFNDRWLSNQFHYLLDTTQFSNGKYLLRLEIFDANGNKMRPIGSGGATSNFHFLKWQDETTTDEVPFDTLLHILHIDNLHCFADVEGLNVDGTNNTANCQFLSGGKGSRFSANFRAYHENGFMWRYQMNYKKGLSGPSGVLESGTSNQPLSKSSGTAAISTSKFFSDMLGGDAKCTFLLELRSFAKHTNGRNRIIAYDDIEKISFALENTDV